MLALFAILSAPDTDGARLNDCVVSVHDNEADDVPAAMQSYQTSVAAVCEVSVES